MAEKSGAHPITKKNLEYHFPKVNDHLKSINRGDPMQRDNLFTLVKGIGSANEELIANKVQSSLEGIIKGFALYYEMNALVENRMKAINSQVEEMEKLAFVNTYSMFSAAAYIQHQLGLLMENREPIEIDANFNFKFDYTKDDVLAYTLAKYFGLINIGKRDEVIKEEVDFPAASYTFFKTLKQNALEKKTGFNPKLVDLIKDSQFKIMDEFTISGFEATHEEKAKAKVEFAPIMPHQVAGNVLAKKEMLRDMDRMALFDQVAQKNPIMEVGGLSWSVLYDGLPGTGKSSLFRMGLTRLKNRTDQVNEFLKSKNLPLMHWQQTIVDQGVKDEYYGKTGKNLLEKLEVTKRPEGLYIITTDDIDLLVAGDRSSSSGGADKDILNILMQYADGINTVIRGNVQWWAATNDATSMDPALRQRFIARYSVDGPEEWFDFADILYDKLKTWTKIGIVKVETGSGYTPYEMRKDQTGHETKDQKTGMFRRVTKALSTALTFKDLGDLFKAEKDKNPRFTGRAVHAVSEAIKKRINDYEIPEEWYARPEIYFGQPYETRVNMLRELCLPVDGDIIAQEIKRYGESEGRYADDKFESDVKKELHYLGVKQETLKRFSSESGDKK